MTGSKQQFITVPSMYVNAFIVRGDRTIIIDTGMPGYDVKIMETLEQNGIKPCDISLILITHGHHDHFGSASALKKKTGAPVAIHKLDSNSLKTGINPTLTPIGALGKGMTGLSGMLKQPEIQGLNPDILIDGEMDLSKYGIAGKVIATPGHTRGSVSVFLDGGCALVGDLIFGGLIRKKSPRLPYFGYDAAEILKSVQKVLELNPIIIYAGHGGPFTATAVRRKFYTA